MSCRRRVRGDRGAATVELALVAPVLVALMFLVVFAGRVADADAAVRRAASEAARAASLRQYPGDAVAAAEATVDANLDQAGVTCSTLAVDVDTGNFRPSGTVGVSVSCTGDMSDVAFIGVPGSRRFTAEAVEVIDTFRSDP